jgi:NhaA family Na+:H+ antiporter
MDPGEGRAAAGPVTALLLGVAFLLDRWAPAGVAFLLDRWAPAGVPFLLFAALAGIGFMVSLLIGELAYGVADRRAEYVRIGVLASSLLAAALAAVIFRSRNRAYRGLAAIEERDSDADGIPDVYDATTPVTTGSAPPTAHSAAGTPRGWG